MTIYAQLGQALTPREVVIVRMIALGYSNKEAAKALNISHRTVEVHRFRARAKLGVTNTAQLVSAAIRANIVGDPREKADQPIFSLYS